MEALLLRMRHAHRLLPATDVACFFCVSCWCDVLSRAWRFVSSVRVCAVEMSSFICSYCKQHSLGTWVHSTASSRWQVRWPLWGFDLRHLFAFQHWTLSSFLLSSRLCTPVCQFIFLFFFSKHFLSTFVVFLFVCYWAVACILEVVWWRSMIMIQGIEVRMLHCSHAITTMPKDAVM